MQIGSEAQLVPKPVRDSFLVQAKTECMPLGSEPSRQALGSRASRCRSAQEETRLRATTALGSVELLGSKRLM